MSITTRTKITMAAGFLSLAGLVGGTAAVAAAAPASFHEGPQAGQFQGSQPGMTHEGILAAAPSTMPGDTMPGD